MKFDIQPLFDFLQTETSPLWVDAALDNLPILLIDHAQCERKAAATAINFMSKYPHFSEIVSVMSPLAREELLHFEKVMAIIQEKGIPFTPLKPSRYAQTLHQEVDKQDDKSKLVDELIIGAIIEARSCERFYRLLPALHDAKLARFYKGLIHSEARHFMDYLRLAKSFHPEAEERAKHLLAIENQYIAEEDSVFRFHSGLPGSKIAAQ